MVTLEIVMTVQNSTGALMGWPKLTSVLLDFSGTMVGYLLHSTKLLYFFSERNCRNCTSAETMMTYRPNIVVTSLINISEADQCDWPTNVDCSFTKDKAREKKVQQKTFLYM